MAVNILEGFFFFFKQKVKYHPKKQSMVVLNECSVITHTGKLFVVLSWEHFYILPRSRHYLMLIHVVIHLLSKEGKKKKKKKRVVCNPGAVYCQHIRGESDPRLLQNVGTSAPRVYSPSTLQFPLLPKA